MKLCPFLIIMTIEWPITRVDRVTYHKGRLSDLSQGSIEWPITRVDSIVKETNPSIYLQRESSLHAHHVIFLFFSTLCVPSAKNLFWGRVIMRRKVWRIVRLITINCLVICASHVTTSSKEMVSIQLRLDT